MTFAVIVQARWGSSRLPGKTLERLGDKTALARCLDRCAAIPGVDVVVCAVPDTPINDPVAQEAASAGATVTRGPEHDVLARYALAAEAVSADLVMRVTSDCPFIDPAVCGRVRDLLLRSGVDYALNAMPIAFPHGLDCDVFPAAWLERAHAEAIAPYDREHVTPFIRNHPEVRRAALVGPGGGVERLRWTLDYPEDLAFCRAVYATAGEGAATMAWRDLADLCAAHPHLTAINAHRVDEHRLKAPAVADVVEVAA